MISKINIPLKKIEKFLMNDYKNKKYE